MSPKTATKTERQPPARLRILDKEVQIACKPGQEDDLMQAAAYIDRSLRDLRKRNNTSSIEKLAIVAAINTANELLRARADSSGGGTGTGSDSSELDERLEKLVQRVDAALESTPSKS